MTATCKTKGKDEKIPLLSYSMCIHKSLNIDYQQLQASGVEVKVMTESTLMMDIQSVSW